MRQTLRDRLRYPLSGSIRGKLFALLVMFMLVPTLVVSTSSQLFMFRSGEQYSASLSDKMIRYVRDSIDTELASIGSSLNNFVLNDDFRYFMDVPKDNTSLQANYEINFRPIVQTILKSNNRLVGFLYLDQLHKVYFESVTGVSIDIEHDFQSDPVYRNVFSASQFMLLPPHIQSYALMQKPTIFSLVKPVFNFKQNEVTSWIAIEIDVSLLKELLRKLDDYSNIGLLLLYDPNTGTTIGGDSSPPALPAGMEMAIDDAAGAIGHFIYSDNKTEYQVTYSTLSISGWRLVNITPLDELLQGSRQTRNVTAIITGISLLLAAIVSFPFMRSFLNPLYRMKAGMQQLSLGHYVTVPYQSRDEFGYVIRAYNKMVSDIQRMEKEVYVSKLREREKELLQLQAQINPHFFFNTLETIESFVQFGDQEAVRDIIRNVSGMMRYNVRNDGGWAPLSEELHHIRRFLNIHKYRNGTELHVRFEIDDDVLDERIMKLSMQPFVENAVKYGWSPNLSRDQFLLRIAAVKAGNGLHIVIENSGRAISEEALDMIRQLVESRAEVVPSFFRQHTGIFNVYRRLVLAYGDDMTFNVSRLHEQITCVEIVIPCKERPSSLQGERAAAPHRASR